METFDEYQQRQLRYYWRAIGDEQAELQNVAYWPEDAQKLQCIAILKASIERISEKIMAIHMVG